MWSTASAKCPLSVPKSSPPWKSGVLVVALLGACSDTHPMDTVMLPDEWAAALGQIVFYGGRVDLLLGQLVPTQGSCSWCPRP